MSSDSFHLWRPHPWHGLSVGPEPPRVVHAYIEVTPFDAVKYEVDKETGYLRVDRPQRASSLPPTLYGFIPRTYCGREVGELSDAERGDADPLDICVLSERRISRAEVLLDARVIGVMRMVDSDEADDKIIAVLHNDPLWASAEDICNIPPVLIERLRHYFITYKMRPGRTSGVRIDRIDGAEIAHEIIAAAMRDYEHQFLQL